MTHTSKKIDSRHPVDCQPETVFMTFPMYKVEHPPIFVFSYFGGGRFVTSPPVGDNFIGLCKIGIGSWIETQVLFHFYFNNTKNMRHSKNFAPLFGQKKCSANFCSVTGNSVGSGCVSLFLVFYISQRE